MKMKMLIAILAKSSGRFTLSLGIYNTNAVRERILRLTHQRQRKSHCTVREKLMEWKEQLLPKHPMAEAVKRAV